MVYRIVFTRNAKKSLDRLPEDVKQRIESALTRIRVRPFDFVDRMINYTFYKLRIGHYRVILDIKNNDLIILVVETGHRRNIYKRFIT